MPYRPLVVALDVARDRHELLPRGTPIASVTVKSMSPGAVFTLHVGQTAGDIEMQADDRLRLNSPADVLAGLFATFPAQPGKVVSLHIELAGGANG